MTAVVVGGGLAGVLAGALWAAVSAWLMDRFSVNEILSTVLLNFVSFELLDYIASSVWSDAGAGGAVTIPIAAAAELPTVARDLRRRVASLRTIASHFGDPSHDSPAEAAMRAKVGGRITAALTALSKPISWANSASPSKKPTSLTTLPSSDARPCSPSSVPSSRCPHCSPCWAHE